MAEVLIAVCLATVGWAVLAPLHRRTPAMATVAMAFPIGAGVYTVAALVVLVVLGRVEPGTTLVGSVVATVVWLAIGRLLGWFRTPSLGILGYVVAVTAAVAALMWWLPLTRLTPDSLRYLLGAADYQLPGAVDHVHRSDLLVRQFGLQSLHALASLTPRSYVASVGPLFGVSGTMFFGWFVWHRLRGSVGFRWTVVALSVAFVLASNRMLYDFFYINTHIMFATLLLVTVCGVWLAVREEQVWWCLPAGIGLAAVLLLRPEAPLIVPLVLIPAAGVALSRAGRFLIVLPVWAVMALWYGAVLWNHARGGSTVSLTAPVFGGLVAIGVGGCVALLGALPGVGRRLGRIAAVVAVPGLVLLLAVFVVRDPDILVQTGIATFHNLTGLGGWSLAWPMLLVLLAVVGPARQLIEPHLFSVPVYGFLVLFWLLPYLREGAYRVGTGDSGNRILAHIFLVALAFALVALLGSDRIGDEARTTGSAP